MHHFARSLLLITAIVLAVQQWRPVAAQSADERRLAHQRFLQQYAVLLRQHDVPPDSADEWKERQKSLRASLWSAWGIQIDDDGQVAAGQPAFDRCPLRARVLGQLDFPEYRIERVIFQTLPDVWMTANAYVPKTDGNSRMPAVLCVHGHWSGAKQDPVVQARCIGLARLGFFVLVVDAFGAGERGVDTSLGEYHGELTAATLLPPDIPLSGLQVLENMRAVDYLQSRPEVDAQRIGITGASGGGNQTMYAGAMDRRLRAVVPTCSVGNYQAYLRAACCLCEVVPAALKFTEEGDVLGLAADRGLMVISATQDAYQFSVDQAAISVERARRISALLKPQLPPASLVPHTIIESPHHYNQPMREAMYGWMTLQLKGVGDGRPISEAPIETVDRQLLRCFPDNSRPDDFMTVPRFAAREARRQLQLRAQHQDTQFLSELRAATDAAQRQQVHAAAAARLSTVLALPSSAAPLDLQLQQTDGPTGRVLSFNTEAGLQLWALIDEHTDAIPAADRRLAILMDVDAGAQAVFQSTHADELRASGWHVVAPELRGTGTLAHPADRIGHASDHNSAEWSLWLGRPLPGQWVVDISRTLDAVQAASEFRQAGTPAATSPASIRPQQIAVVGVGAAGTVALAAAALDSRISAVVAIDSLATYVSDVPYREQRLGLMVPGILSAVGDIQHLAALTAPRPVVIAGAVHGSGRPLTNAELELQFSFATRVFTAHPASPQLQLTGSDAGIQALNAVDGALKERP